MNLETLKKELEDDLKRTGCTVRKVVPDGNEQISDLKAYFMKKYLSRDDVKLTLFIDIARNGRTDEKIEYDIKELKVRAIAYIDSQSPVRLSDRVEIKTKYKIV